MLFPAQSVDAPAPLPKLPAANWLIKLDPKLGFYLEMADEFTLPAKLYGNAGQLASRVVSTFSRRGQNTGVMLIGEKGSGKSMTAKAICKLMVDLGHPVLLLTQPFTGADFLAFLTLIDEPCALFMDEFEKVYNDSEDQEAMLTVLDGVFPSRKLFLMTCNDYYRVDKKLSNRPGRLHYWIEYKGISPQEIREYAEDKLDNKKLVKDICTAASAFQNSMNFDMLRALVEETNLYPDLKVSDHLKLLNIHPGYADDCCYDIDLIVNGKSIPSDFMGSFHGENGGFYPVMTRSNPVLFGVAGGETPTGMRINVGRAAALALGLVQNPADKRGRQGGAAASHAADDIMDKIASLSQGSSLDISIPQPEAPETDLEFSWGDENQDCDEPRGRHGSHVITVKSQHLVSHDVENGVFTFKVDGVTVVFSRRRELDSRSSEHYGAAF